ncbi:hypothetical protein DFS34DRAFT_615471 [Phlyctochytrium arcticum]|nr:hypothetical protein DFS34DRAFT_615471 [Phlyctochytrium arcticum]
MADSDGDHTIQVPLGPFLECIQLPLKRGKVHEKLFTSDLPKVLLVGEGATFTFTAAFVALRCSVANVVTTTLETHEPDWDNAVGTALAHAERNQNLLLRINRDTTVFSLEGVKQRYNAVFGNPAIGPAYIAEVDACKLQSYAEGTSVRTHSCNIFFQCPYTFSRGNYFATAELCSGLMSSSGQVQKKGGTLYIGICTDPSYSQAYQLTKLITHHAPKNGYIFDCADDRTIRWLLQLGYRHQSNVKDIHDWILNKHLTLIFTKTENGWYSFLCSVTY